MANWPNRYYEGQFVKALSTGRDLEGTSSRGGYFEKYGLGIAPERRMADRVNELVGDRHNRVLTDDRWSFGVLLVGGHPERYFDRVDKGDGPFGRVLDRPARPRRLPPRLTLARGPDRQALPGAPAAGRAAGLRRGPRHGAVRAVPGAVGVRPRTNARRGRWPLGSSKRCVGSSTNAVRVQPSASSQRAWGRDDRRRSTPREVGTADAPVVPRHKDMARASPWPSATAWRSPTAEPAPNLGRSSPARLSSARARRRRSAG